MSLAQPGRGACEKVCCCCVKFSTQTGCTPRTLILFSFGKMGVGGGVGGMKSQSLGVKGPRGRVISSATLLGPRTTTAFPMPGGKARSPEVGGQVSPSSALSNPRDRANPLCPDSLASRHLREVQ